MKSDEHMKRDRMTMWFITVFEELGTTKLGWPDVGSCRTWGFYFNRDTAVRALHENWTDMRECLYNYAVIEGLDEGICAYHHHSKDQWFEWDEERQGYYEIDPPSWAQHVANWAL